MQVRPRGCSEFRHHFHSITPLLSSLALLFAASAFFTHSRPTRHGCIARVAMFTCCRMHAYTCIIRHHLFGIHTRCCEAWSLRFRSHEQIFVPCRPLRIRSDLFHTHLPRCLDQFGSVGGVGSIRVGFKSCAVGGGLRHTSSSWRRRRRTKGAGNRRSRGLPSCLQTNASPKSAGKNAKGAVPWSK